MCLLHRGCSISIHPPLRVNCTFCPTAKASLPSLSPEFDSLCEESESVPREIFLFAGQGRIVEAERLTVRKEAAKVARKKVVVATLRVLIVGLVMVDHILPRFPFNGCVRRGENGERGGYRVAKEVC